MGDRARRSPSACLLWTLAAFLLVLGLGLGGTPQGGAAPGGHPAVAAAGGQGPQAVLDLHAQPRLAEHPGKAAGLPVALGVALLLARWRCSPRVRTSVAAVGRPAALGSRAPPQPSTSA